MDRRIMSTTFNVWIPPMKGEADGKHFTVPKDVYLYIRHLEMLANVRKFSKIKLTNQK